MSSTSIKRIAIIGSREYTNSNKVKDCIFKLKEKFGDSVEIVSGGQKYGADGYAKKYALLFEMKYVEFPPAHYPYNQYCIRESVHYNKPYRVHNFFERNTQLIKYSDYVIAFMNKGKVTPGTKHALEVAKKNNKKVIIIN